MSAAPSAAVLLQVSFMRNNTGKVVYDRRFNTTALLANYYGSNVDFAGRINWNPQVQRSAPSAAVTAAWREDA
jgi:hypothetical protein